MLAVAAGAAGIGAWGEGATLLFLFHFPARSNITRWVARKRRSAHSSATRRKSPPSWIPMAASTKSKSGSLNPGCAF